MYDDSTRSKFGRRMSRVKGDLVLVLVLVRLGLSFFRDDISALFEE